MGVQSAVFEIIHESLKNNVSSLSVTALCEIAGVSRSGYYNWVNSEATRARKEAKDREDFELILEAYNFRGYKKGVLGINMRLLHMGIIMNPKKIRRLMHRFNLFCPIRKANPYRRMAKALRTSNVADNLLNREFESHGPRMVLLTDITYIGFRDGFLYLSTILDAYTKEALAHVLSNSLEIDFVLETVKNMQRDYGVSLKAETMIHSDQGSHYTSVQFIQIVNDIGLRQSMSTGWLATRSSRTLRGHSAMHLPQDWHLSSSTTAIFFAWSIWMALKLQTRSQFPRPRQADPSGRLPGRNSAIRSRSKRCSSPHPRALISAGP